MPPIRRRTTQKKSSSKSRRTSNKKLGKRPVRNYNRQLKNRQYKTSNMLRIRTLIPKEIRVGIQYKTTLVFSNMGYGGNGAVATLIKISLNNPTMGNATPSSNTSGNIVDVVSLGGNYTDPVFTRTNASQMTLQAELADYFDQYGKAVVTSSNSKVRIVGRPNQFKLGQTFYNGSAAGAHGDSYPYAQNHPPFLAVKGPELDGEMYVTSVKQRQTGLLHPQQGDTLSFHDIQTKLPGAKMRRLTCYPDKVSKGIMSVASYTPRNTMNIKDWADNIGDLQCSSGVGINQQQKPAYHYVAVHNRQPATATLKPANVVAEIVVNYNIRFLDRKNNFEGGDDPIPQPIHQEEL